MSNSGSKSTHWTLDGKLFLLQEFKLAEGK